MQTITQANHQCTLPRCPQANVRRYILMHNFLKLKWLFLWETFSYSCQGSFFFLLQRKTIILSDCLFRMMRSLLLGFGLELYIPVPKYQVCAPKNYSVSTVWLWGTKMGLSEEGKKVRSDFESIERILQGKKSHEQAFERAEQHFSNRWTMSVFCFFWKQFHTVWSCIEIPVL